MPAYQQARRQRIVDAATRLLYRDDFDNIQIREVAEEAGVALGTLYRYFSSKEHLYGAVLLNWAEPFVRGADTEGGAGNVQERLRRRMASAIAAFERRPQFYRVQFELTSSADPNARRAMEEFGERNIDAVRREMHGMTDEVADDMTTLIFAVLTYQLTAVVFRGLPVEDAYRVMDRTIDLIAQFADPRPERGPSSR